MDPLFIGILGMIGIFVLIVFHVPIGVAMALAGLASLTAMESFPQAVSLFATEPASVLGNMDIGVIPLFLLMGSFASRAGLSGDIYRLVYAFVGRFRGGLAMATVGGCAGFGAVCGSSVATVATMARVSLPEMLDRGYSPALATGCIAAGGTLGMLIPPSVVLVLYGFLTEEFIIALFTAAVIPGLIAVAVYGIAIALYVHIWPQAGPPGPRLSWRQRGGAATGAWAAIFLAVLVLGGLYGGVFTVTEAAAIGAGTAFLFALGRRRINFKTFSLVLLETAANTGMIYVLIIGASIFSFTITLSGMPELTVDWIASLGLPPLSVIFGLLVMYLVLGAIFETISAMVLTLPFVFPLILQLGYDPIWWGIVMVMVIEIGLITPPIGINVFVLHGMAKDIPLKTIFAGIVPFFFADLVRLAIVVLFPVLALWLPRALGML